MEKDHLIECDSEDAKIYITEMQMERAAQRERRAVILGTMLIIAIGLVLGFATPVPSDLKEHNERLGRLSNVIGWLYFAAWTVSFYPQAMLNYSRKSVIGMAFDYQVYNVIGFGFYGTFNCMLYFSTYVKRKYREEHNGKGNQIQLSDVFFSVHAFIMSLFIVGQIFIYERGNQRVSLFCKIISVCMLLVVLVYAILCVTVHKHIFVWLTFLNVLADIKLGITFVKFIPQLYLNYKRKSTVGCNIHNFLMDFTGGIMSVGQLVMDSQITHDWSAVTGDVAKFGLGLTSMFFDTLFFVQHYILYTDRRDPALIARLNKEVNSESNPLLDGSIQKETS